MLMLATKQSPIYPYRKEKETHVLIFSWLRWLKVLLVNANPGIQAHHKVTKLKVIKILAYPGLVWLGGLITGLRF